MFDDTERKKYEWIHGGKVRHSRYDYPVFDELRDEEGEVVPGCYRTLPAPNPDDL